MDKQRTVFFEGEGNAWFRRNASAIAKMHARAIDDPITDPVLRCLDGHRPGHVLEVGASNGWRLDVMRRCWGAMVVGVEPSALAAASAPKGVPIHIGTADALPIGDAEVNCVVFGFCLYLCDREDLGKITAEADRVLADDGLLVVYDFSPKVEFSRPYHHRVGISSFKRDHSDLWKAMGYVALGREDMPEEVAVTVLRKPRGHSRPSGHKTKCFHHAEVPLVMSPIV